MILAIDVGNTNIVLGCIENGEILNIVRIQTLLHETEVEYAIKLKQVLDYYGIDPRSFEGAILSSVVPPVTVSLTAAVKSLTGRDCMVVGPGMKTGMNVRIDDPSTLAGDLVVGSVAAMTCYGVPSIIMDMGTATTVVVVDKDRCYRGGAIMPGVKLSYEALAAGTSLLPDISITPPKKPIGTNTVDAMRSGAVFASAAAIDGMIDRMEEELGYPCKLVATGGIAQAVTPYCRHTIICDNDLLLKGLWALYEKNRKA
ncbi:MAG: type III pantothenate kinase [Oscillospiraceae bacterium]|nr:type III pantothenate kinase [Oscillospiraceae bacterium]